MAFSTPDTRITGYVITADNWNELVNNDLAINSFQRQNLWPDYEAHAPASGLTAAGISVVESSVGDTYKPLIPIVGFIGTADEGRQWTCRWPRGFGVGAAIAATYYMTGANTSDEVVMEAYVSAVSDGDTAMTAKGYDSANSITHTVPDAAGTADIFTISLTNGDSFAALDWVNILLVRNGDDGSDTANVGDLALTSLVVDFDLAS